MDSLPKRVEIITRSNEHDLTWALNQFLEDNQGNIALVSYSVGHNVNGGAAVAAPNPYVTGTGTSNVTVQMNAPASGIFSTPVYSVMVILKDPDPSDFNPPK